MRMMIVVGGVLVRGAVGTQRPPFSVLWNSPWPGCCGIKAEQQLLPAAIPLPMFVEHNITVNDNRDPWSSAGTTDCGNVTHIPCVNGHHVVTIYDEDTGLYPDFHQNATTKQWYAVNGGLPQSVNLSAHLAQWQIGIEKMIPDKDAAPVVGLDWESWEPWWEGNSKRWMTGDSVDIFQNESIKLVKAKHPTWGDAQVLSEARTEFNLGAQQFWTKTFELAKKLRPNALWSNYHVGHCGTFGCGDAEYWGFMEQEQRLGRSPKTNMPASQPPPMCAVPNDNDSPGLQWLWKLVDVLEPVMYLSNQNASFNAQFIDCTLGEARRVATLARKLRGGKRESRSLLRRLLLGASVQASRGVIA
jgi:hypothetical protein